MSNQEKLTPNRQEQDIQSPETIHHKEVALQEPAAESPEVVTASLAHVEGQMKSELDELNKVRQSLGLPPTESSVAVDHLSTKREGLSIKLTNAPDVAPLQEGEKAPTQEFLKKDLEGLSNQLGSLSGQLTKRDGGRLTPLIDGSNLSKIRAATQLLGDSARVGKVDFAQLTGALRSVNKSFENFGQIRSPGGVREDAESLKTIASFARATHEALVQTQKSLAKSPDAGAQEASATAKALASTMEKVWLSTSQRIRGVANYSRGR